MITDAQKELIAIEVIRTLYTQFNKFPEDETNNRNAPFHEAFLNAFSEKLEGKVVSIPIFISLASWMHGLNTSLGQSFLEKTAHILCNGKKKEFTANKRTGLKISTKQKSIVNSIITDLTNGNRIPNLDEENKECLFQETPNIDATDFIADVYFQDDEQIVCIELKTVKPNKGVFKVEKEKVLEAKIALKNIYPDKVIRYFLAFPFDPLSDTQTGYDKQRFMDYCVGFRKYFTEDEFLLSSELWDYLSDETQIMEIILEIINAIATVDFLKKFEFIQNKNNISNVIEYTQLLQNWRLLREKRLVKNHNLLVQKIAGNKSLLRIFHQDIFTPDGSYNENRFNKLREFLL